MKKRQKDGALKAAVLAQRAREVSAAGSTSVAPLVAAETVKEVTDRQQAVAWRRYARAHGLLAEEALEAAEACERRDKQAALVERDLAAAERDMAERAAGDTPEACIRRSPKMRGI